MYTLLIKKDNGYIFSYLKDLEELKAQINYFLTIGYLLKDFTVMNSKGERKAIDRMDVVETNTYKIDVKDKGSTIH